MGLCVLKSIVDIRQTVLALIEDLRKLTPIERFVQISKISDEGQWKLTQLVGKLRTKDLAVTGPNARDQN